MNSCRMSHPHMPNAACSGDSVDSCSRMHPHKHPADNYCSGDLEFELGLARQRIADLEKQVKPANDKMFWLVWCLDGPGNGWPTFRHWFEEAANKEAIRLAETHQTKTFYVMQATARALVPQAKVFEMLEPPLPF